MKTSIEWTDFTFNIAWGCVKISPGCKNCYADTWANRYGFNVWGPNSGRRVFGAKHWADPLKWNRIASESKTRLKVFCSSMCDIFEDHPTIDIEREKLWSLIRVTPWLDWQLLTKRADRILPRLPEDWGNSGYHNVWFGVSVENQQTADIRIPYLLDVPAAIRFVSYEPALSGVNFNPYLNTKFHDSGCASLHSKLNWIIVGGESGQGARPFDIQWARSVIVQCGNAGAVVFVKQLGSAPYLGNIVGPGEKYRYPDKKGGNMDEWPPDLRVRQFPEPG